MRKILYVYGNCTPHKYKELVESKGIMILQQAQKYHSLMIDGLRKNGCEVLVLSSLPVNRELTKKIFFKSEDDEFENVKYRYLSFINLPVLRNVSIFVNSFVFVLKHRQYDVVCDVLHISISAGVLLASRKGINKRVGIVTDIPGAENYENRKKLSLKDRINRSLINRFDAYLLLTEQMNSVVNKNNKPYTVIEGQADINSGKNENTIDGKYEKNVCIYAGSLHRKYGIDILVNAFIIANVHNAELHIYGAGDYEDKIKELSEKNNNIRYFGFKSNDYIVAELTKAVLLINPRPSGREYTKYSFPSKNMEYMASGTSVLTTKLPGIPSEYYDYVYLIEDETEEGLAKTLKKVLSKSGEELFEHGLRAKDFVIKEKNNVIQAKKLLDLFTVANGE